jgi:hypothetical protein
METPKEGGENEKRQKQQKHKTQKLRRGSHGEQRKQLSVQELAVVVYWQKLVFQPVDPQRVQLSGAAQSGAAPPFFGTADCAAAFTDQYSVHSAH